MRTIHHPRCLCHVENSDKEISKKSRMHAIHFPCVAPIHCDLFLETTAAFDKTLVLARGNGPFMMMMLLAVARTDVDLT